MRSSSTSVSQTLWTGCPGEFGRFVDHVPARGLLEAIKYRSEKETVRLKAQTAQTGLPLS